MSRAIHESSACVARQGWPTNEVEFDPQPLEGFEEHEKNYTHPAYALSKKQATAVAWLYNILSDPQVGQKGGILAYEPGTGKTRIALVLLYLLRGELPCGIVTVPKSAQPQWVHQEQLLFPCPPHLRDEFKKLQFEFRNRVVLYGENKPLDSEVLIELFE